MSRTFPLLILLILLLGPTVLAETAMPETTAAPDVQGETAEAPELAVVTLNRNPDIALRKMKTVSSVFDASGSAKRNEIVTVLREEGQWSYVLAENGEGYIMSRFLKPYDPSAVLSPTPEPAPAPTASPEPTLIPQDFPDPTAYLDTRAAFPPEENEAQKVLLSFIGDVTLGSNEADHSNPKSIDSYIAQYGYEYPFRRVSYILEQDDLTVANFEGTFHSDTSGLTPLTKKAYNFRADPGYVEILKGASIEAVALGNNHISDYGEPGFNETVEVLEQNGIGWFGNTPYSAKGYIYERDGVKIGMVSCYISYWVINNGEHVPLINGIIDELRAADVDVLIAYMHGGVEYAAKHDRNQEHFVNYFIKKGVDIIIGGHPHCLQGCYITEGVPVFYSLGNFVFGGNFKFYTTKYKKYIKYTAILQCALSFDEEHHYLGCRFNIIPCRLGEDKLNNQYQPFPVTGEEADECIAVMAVDTNRNWQLEPVIPDVGALQRFIPAKR